MIHVEVNNIYYLCVLIKVEKVKISSNLAQIDDL